MTIYLNYTKLLQRNQQFKVYFKGSNNASCITHHNTSTNNINNKTIFLQANFDECGINMFAKDGNIVYNQTILVTFGKNPTGSQIVFRQEEIAFDVECTKLNNITVHLDGAYVNVTSLKKQTFSKCKLQRLKLYLRTPFSLSIITYNKDKSALSYNLEIATFNNFQFTGHYLG